MTFINASVAICYSAELFIWQSPSTIVCLAFLTLENTQTFKSYELLTSQYTSLELVFPRCGSVSTCSVNEHQYTAVHSFKRLICFAVNATDRKAIFQTFRQNASLYFCKYKHNSCLLGCCWQSSYSRSCASVNLARCTTSCLMAEEKNERTFGELFRDTVN